MRIGISAWASDGGLSGISIYMRTLLRWLPRLAQDHELELIADEDDLAYLDPPPGVRVLPHPHRLAAPLRNIVWHQLELPRLAAARRLDVVFIPAANRRVPFACPCPTVGTVHDLASFHVDGKYDALRGVYVRHVLPRLIPRLSRVIAVSESARRDILERCAIAPERVTVIPHGVDTERFTPGDPAAARERLRSFGVRGPFFVYVARIEHPGKNHVRLIEAFETVKDLGLPHRLVLAGADRERAAEVHARAAASRHAADILFLGFVPDDVVTALYRAAEALVLPSLHEGFGVPVIEAMACGAPVVCSDVSSLPEVAGDAALYCDPLSAASIADALESVARDPVRRAELARASLRRASKFSMEATMRHTWAVVEEAARRVVRQPSPSSLNFSSRTL